METSRIYDAKKNRPFSCILRLNEIIILAILKTIGNYFCSYRFYVSARLMVSYCKTLYLKTKSLNIIALCMILEPTDFEYPYRKTKLIYLQFRLCLLYQFHQD